MSENRAVTTSEWITYNGRPHWAREGSTTLLARNIYEYVTRYPRSNTLIVVAGSMRIAEYVERLVIDLFREHRFENWRTQYPRERWNVAFVTPQTLLTGYRGPVMFDAGVVEKFALDVAGAEREHAKNNACLAQAIEYNLNTYLDDLLEVRYANTGLANEIGAALEREQVLADAYLGALDHVADLERRLVEIAKLVAT